MGELANQRTERKMARLREVAELYREALISGSGTPAADIAAKLGANPTTVRTWIHRARAEGLLNQYPTRGRGHAREVAYRLLALEYPDRFREIFEDQMRRIADRPRADWPGVKA